ncbi:hypothetical protein DPEC_G00161860 [Dallia pectoralis]|uniref:Uncharacterized protein n=1 Tax=Dallia pectoralis TaxID=75939 RepID=A0ACC2GGB5_DALPE|nr:hypothetical protein DPEC_G00161860 [Dallia pectoralis]
MPKLFHFARTSNVARDGYRQSDIADTTVSTSQAGQAIPGSGAERMRCGACETRIVPESSGFSEVEIIKSYLRSVGQERPSGSAILSLDKEHGFERHSQRRRSPNVSYVYWAGYQDSLDVSGFIELCTVHCLSIYDYA